MGGSSAHYGHRVREIRKARGLLSEDTGVSRSYLSKIEYEHQGASLGCLERICEALGVGFARFFCPQDKFEALLLLEDKFVAEVLPFLKRLNAEHKKLILQTLEAAPKCKPVQKRSRRSARTRNLTYNESSKFTECKVLPTSFLI